MDVFINSELAKVKKKIKIIIIAINLADRQKNFVRSRGQEKFENPHYDTINLIQLLILCNDHKRFLLKFDDSNRN